MQTPPKMTPEDWEALIAKLFAEPQEGVPQATISSLAREYGISRALIHGQLKKRNLTWSIDRQAAKKASLDEEAQHRDRIAQTPAPPPLPGYRPPEAIRAQGDALRETLPASLRPILDAAAIRQVALERLKERNERMAGLAERLVHLVQVALTTPKDDDQVGLTKKMQALSTLLPGKNDGIPAIVASITSLTNTLRISEAGVLRLELDGLNDRHKYESESGALDGLGAEGDDIDSLSTEEKAQLLDAINILEGTSRRAPIPMPPRRVIDVRPDEGEDDAT
ncbi:hypothetical protein EOD42_13980 [Rhodovarius crocodyli]|uniref:Uncharacterized protein n=1 Tax=Rhodovarius crocodyli TaxID=1979269 RepID=A0A437MEX7_9PROT|nr:hypothetical protein [Rhodovarius crocodyli]RVT96220.1 hypothetical protein EOD42_13980 [Rhodovarius crocodyli]